jgi:DNA repair protein RecN (Recombination protein N)
MLEEISISGLGVIGASTLELGPGLTVITGETGAGKTMVVTALGLLLGGRADPGAVRRGTAQARVEGIAWLKDLPQTADAVTRAGGVVEDDRVVLARTVVAEGRSRAFAGGASVPVAVLGEIAAPLVAVHGQSDQHRLLKPAAQREALDRFAGPEHADLLKDYAELYADLTAVQRELAAVTASRLERAREADLLQFGLDEVSRVAPLPGEDLELSAQEARLGFADELRRAAEQARAALSSDDGSHDALNAAATARNVMHAVRDHDPEAAGLADRLAEVTYAVSDLAADVASYAAGLDSDPAQLAAVSERRSQLATLTRKYGDTIDDVLAWAATAAVRMGELLHTDEHLDQLRARQDDLRHSLATAGAALSKGRSEAAQRLSEEVTDELSALAMPHARVAVTVRQHETTAPDAEDVTGLQRALLVGERWVQFGATGIDEVEFLLSANLGGEPRSLAKGASGGELSRVMLALEVSLAGTSPVPTFVFDEVDAGVGGKAAVEVGRRLAQLSRTAQVIVVTHLPQVAAYADRHIVVEKADDGWVTTSGLQTLDDAGRERELSRMLAGLEDSTTGLEHARELLAAAEIGRRNPGEAR